jgi:hypothetical protein
VLIASGLFVRTVLHSLRVAPGFEIDRTVFLTVQEKPLPLETVGAEARSLAVVHRLALTSELEQLPLVRAVAAGQPPVGAEAVAASTSPRTIRMGSREDRMLVGVMTGTPNLLSVLGVPLLAGRALEDADAFGTTPRPVVITRSLAERLCPAGDALGHTFVIPELRGGASVVVGIAGDFAYGTLSRPMGGVIVTAEGERDYTMSSVVLQTDDASAVIAAARKLLADRVVRLVSGREMIARDIAQQRLGAWAFSAFGVVAWLLSVGGVFGLVTYFTQSRRRECGVRMALGATPQDLVRHGVTTALVPVAVGVTTGLLIGAFASRVFAALLVGIDSLDPVTYVVVGTAMLTCATLAALAGAWRLRRTTPSDALRSV